MPVDPPMLCVTAIVLGVLHTILGPDHYLPFVAMAEAGGWSARKSVAVTVACGLGHVIGSVVIGIVGLAFGVAVMRLEAFEAFRGDAAAWLLIGFGLALLVAGVRRAGQRENRDSTVPAWVPWLAFLVFVLGPCEPLIPLLMVPAAQGSPAAVAAVVATYTAATVGTMVVAVLVMRHGLSRVRWPTVGRVGHAVAGLVIVACGVLVKIGL